MTPLAMFSSMPWDAVKKKLYRTFSKLPNECQKERPRVITQNKSEVKDGGFPP